jgi:hypothetical protein
MCMSTRETSALSAEAVATITAVARCLYPHPKLPTEVYGRVATVVGAAAQDDPDTAELVDAGLSALSRLRPFAEMSPDEQVALLQAAQGSPFFELVRSTAVVEVYSDPRTWALCGYEGPSFEAGGYLDRGFDDLDWLPDPEMTG